VHKEGLNAAESAEALRHESRPAESVSVRHYLSASWQGNSAKEKINKNILLSYEINEEYSHFRTKTLKKYFKLTKYYCLLIH